MTAVTLREAQLHLGDIIRDHSPGADIAIVENGVIVAHLIVQGQESAPAERRLGTMRGSVVSMSADFDAPLEDMREYME